MGLARVWRFVCHCVFAYDIYADGRWAQRFPCEKTKIMYTLFSTAKVPIHRTNKSPNPACFVWLNIFMRAGPIKMICRRWLFDLYFGWLWFRNGKAEFEKETTNIRCWLGTIGLSVFRNEMSELTILFENHLAPLSSFRLDYGSWNCHFD